MIKYAGMTTRQKINFVLLPFIVVDFNKFIKIEISYIFLKFSSQNVAQTA